jgi:hypothetical protein
VQRLSAAGARVVQLRLGLNLATDATSQGEELTGVVPDVRAALSHLLDEHFSGQVLGDGGISEYSPDESARDAVGAARTRREP